ncbi:TIGR03943 family protein [Streptomyces sp. NBC_00038]|uniref:TIGR03943 family putative permease subunit n=1 Tax=Streptomyces sp. NBC_00038 TaxID=2903615 RepID=UPI00224DA32A|nr:TIGR03943 family protein [Streptomyces sp. NBC_00038]MCX5559188.1 TIGR03943 family protein [Streptomyces sp. NBC_00038]
MRRYGPALLLLLSGAAVLRITVFSDLYLRYVQSGLKVYLIASGVLLLALGALSAVRATRTHDHEAEDEDEADAQAGDEDHGHNHHRTPRIAWLLTVPAAALLLFPPPALGSYSADREAEQRAAQGVGTFPALPSGDPVALTLGEYTSRAIYDSGKSLTGRAVRMTGFVTRGDNGTWYLARLLITCCAADASTYKIEIKGADAPVNDTWVTVTGTWHPKGKLGSDEAWPPVLDSTSVKTVKEPANPYERR